MLTYLCGGVLRLNTLRYMFAFLRSHGIAIRILTNNPTAGDPKSAALFKELVNALVQGDDVEVWCSYFPPASGDKGVIMRREFPDLCAMAGGRRRKTVRRKMVRRRKSRHRK
jgi:hypothetical protein